jgi:hypothetical protein
MISLLLIAVVGTIFLLARCALSAPSMVSR